MSTRMYYMTPCPCQGADRTSPSTLNHCGNGQTPPPSLLPEHPNPSSVTSNPTLPEFAISRYCLHALVPAASPSEEASLEPLGSQIWKPWNDVPNPLSITQTKLHMFPRDRVKIRPKQNDISSTSAVTWKCVSPEKTTSIDSTLPLPLKRLANKLPITKTPK